MIGPKVDWPGLIVRVEELIRKEESHLQYLTESKCDPVRIKQSNTILTRYRERLDDYRKVFEANENKFTIK